jgi:hypothetical protein
MAAKAVPLAEAEPFATFGAQGFKGEGIAPRVAFFQVYPISGSKIPVLNGKIDHFIYENGNNGFKNINIAPFESVFEVILSVDSMGKAPLGAKVRLSGSKSLDEAIARWAQATDWSKQLPPGVYRLIVGP